MAEKQISLIQAEWSMMECLWGEDAALGETQDFLDRVYQGSLSLMVSSLTQKQSLSQEELDELYELLKGLEGEHHA